MAWMAGIQTITRRKPMTWTTIDATVTAVGKFWNHNDKKWDRSAHPQLSDQLKGLKKTNPSHPRKSKPITMAILNRGVSNWIKGKKRNIQTLTQLSMLYGAYYFGNRAAEYTNRKKINQQQWQDIASCDPNKSIFQVKHLSFQKDKNNKVISVVYHIPISKTNQFGEKFEGVEASCTCKSKFSLCVPHLYLEMFKRRRESGEKITPNSPVLLSNGYPVTYSEARKFVREIIAAAGLNPDHYGTHGLRKGRATDLAMNHVPAWIIKKWGRWSSECWQQFYAKLDHSDVAKVTGTHLLATTSAIHAADVAAHKALQDTSGYQLL